MNEISSKVTTQGVSFTQQYLLHKGLKVLSEREDRGLMKEKKLAVSEKLFLTNISCKYDFHRKEEGNDGFNVSKGEM